MDLLKVILQEHSRSQALKIAKFVGPDAKRFEMLVDIFLKGPYRVTQRAAWPLSKCVEKHPLLIMPHLKKILDRVQRPGIHDAVKRNIIRLLQFIDIPKRYHGRTADICFTFLRNAREPVAIRVFAMTVLADISMYYPEIMPELRIILEDELPYGSPAFISRARKVLRELGEARGGSE
jgi:hypothetical protein